MLAGENEFFTGARPAATAPLRPKPAGKHGKGKRPTFLVPSNAGEAFVAARWRDARAAKFQLVK